MNFSACTYAPNRLQPEHCQFLNAQQFYARLAQQMLEDTKKRPWLMFESSSLSTKSPPPPLSSLLWIYRSIRVYNPETKTNLPTSWRMTKTKYFEGSDGKHNIRLFLCPGSHTTRLLLLTIATPIDRADHFILNPIPHTSWKDQIRQLFFWGFFRV